MRYRLLSATSLVTTLIFLVPGVAVAQSQPHDWSGPYLGAAIGGLLGSGTIDIDSSVSSSPKSISVPMLGPSGTIVGGYNFQRDSVVYGVEGDLSALYATGQSTGSMYTANERLYALLSLRGRLGLATGPLMFYATAGLAGGYARFDTTIDLGGAGTVVPAMGAGIVLGPTAGIGGEYALNDNVSLTAEGSVTMLGTLTATGDNGKGSYTATSRSTSVGVQTGMKFHF